MEIWRRTRGNLDAHVRLSEVAAAMHMDMGQAMTHARQMNKDGWVGLSL
jgi:hypothetical protein